MLHPHIARRRAMRDGRGGSRRPPAARAAATAALLAALPGGCAAPPRSWAFACPAAGNEAAYDDGRTLRFAGADPAAPSICVAGSESGEVRLIHGLIGPAANEGRGHAEGMAPLWPARAGGQARYRSTLRSEGSGIQYEFDAVWRVVGFEPVQVPAGRFDALVLERRWSQRSGGELDMVLRYWIDTATAIPVRREVEVLRGATLFGPWQATRVTPAPGQTARGPGP